MAPDATTVAAHASRSDTRLRRLLGGMSVFTMLMTVPQVLTIWVGHQAGGVSIRGAHISLPPFSGCGSECTNATRIFTYHALAGLRWTVP